MPKTKTHRAAAKRLRVTGSGHVRCGRAGLSHMMRGKSARRRRRLRKNGILGTADAKRVKRLLPYSF